VFLNIQEVADTPPTIEPTPAPLFQGKLISALAHMFLGHFEEAASLAEQIVAGRPTFVPVGVL